MEALRQVFGQVFGAAAAEFAAGGPYGAPSLCGALLFTLGWFAWRRRGRGRALHLKVFVRAIFPARVLTHPSTWVDLRLWTLNALVLAASYAGLAVGALFWRDRLVALLSHLGPVGMWHAPLGLSLLVATLVELLAYELGYWASHYAFHRISWLWPFHKVHHSAQVMTVLTEMRQHPVEIVFFINAIALCTGLAFGAMTWVFGPGVGRLTLLNGNIVLAIFMLSWGHLRHSHLWIPFRGVAGCLFQSPAHHQVHHSLDPRHYDKNLGFALAVWDWAFGTLHVPSAACEVSQFGVGEEYEDYATVTRSLVRPFVKAGEALGLGAPQAPGAAAHDG
jgi:sterol desaturase/sphingolipid hydroxylase (fatty acid hydroxylase superfamily)